MIRIQIFGSRGSIATPGTATAKYGGNTACLTVVGCPHRGPGRASDPEAPRLILDAGTGLALLQPELLAGLSGKGRAELFLLLSHFHWDHLIGLPFFAPLFFSGNRVHLYGPRREAVQESVERLFTSVYSPIQGTQNLAAEVSYHALPRQEAELGGFLVATAPNSHPSECLSIRVRYGETTLVYSTDHEAGDADTDSSLVAFARGADVWILDAQYTPDEYESHRGWGHSSFLDAVALARRAGVRRLVLFHHDPSHDDRTLDRIGLQAQDACRDTGLEVLVARDGMLLEV